MKWKTILVTAVIVLLVVVVVLLVAFGPHKEIKGRITQYKLVLEEQQLITDILTLKYEVAVIQSKFKPAPPETRTVIESQQEKE